MLRTLSCVTTNIFTSIWPIEDKQEMWWPAKHSTELPAQQDHPLNTFQGVTCESAILEAILYLVAILKYVNYR